MTLQEALTILTTFQLWRISDDDVHIQEPSEITNALDVLLNHCVGTLELPKQEICINCDDEKETHEICMDCIGKMIKENQAHLYTEEQVREAIEMSRDGIFGFKYTTKEIIQSLKQPKKD